MKEIALLKVNPKNMQGSLQSTKKIVSYTIIYNRHIQKSCTNITYFQDQRLSPICEAQRSLTENKEEE